MRSKSPIANNGKARNRNQYECAGREAVSERMVNAYETHDRLAEMREVYAGVYAGREAVRAEAERQ
jgi:hypothetical protein